MNTEDIEIESTSYLKSTLVKTGYLSPFISEEDKEPSWDGNIYIYSNTNKRKENLVGRLPVQVKGKISDDLSRDEITFEAEISDLKNYLNDGGVLYFVVYISKNYSNHKIYYADLAPVKLKTLLNNTNEQKYKNIKLISLPNDTEEICNIFLTTHKNFQMQKSYIYANLPTFDSLDRTTVNKFTIPLMSIGKIENANELLFKTPTYMYVESTNSIIPQPLGVIISNITTSEIIYKKISINGINYYDSFLQTRNKNNTQIRLGNSLVISFNQDNTSVNYKGSDYLRIRTKDLDFFLNLLEHKKIEIDSKKYEIPLNNDNNEFDIDAAKSNLQKLKRISLIFDLLNYQGDVDLSKFTDREWRDLWYLDKAFIDKEDVVIQNDNIPSLSIIDIGGIKFLLTFTHNKTNKNMYHIDDFGNSIYSIGYFNEKIEKYIPTSQYVLLNSDDYIQCKNIRYDKILQSFMELDIDENIVSQANQVLLELIKAFDVNNDSNIIKAALDISNWLLKKEFDLYLSYEIRLLNNLQIIKRTRKLDMKEINKLVELIDSSSEYLYKAGAYILLDKYDEASDCINHLEEPFISEFKNYPIYNFMIKFNNTGK